MRPIRLVMSAFGPYNEKIEIDFEKLGGNGIFLITGDTGSGKTTIFDAISFALFGVTSGSRRENIRLRSDFADDKVKSFVELEFLHKGILYKVERVPRYARNKIRGSGITVVLGDATLVYLDEVITGDKNVSEKCIEILGINANQFKQIVMIAQGEFMDLLLAKPKDRAVIFRKIFDTDIYKSISDSLKEKYLSKRREYEDVIVSLNNYKESIIWEEEIDKDISVVSLLEMLNEYNNKLRLEEINVNTLKGELDKEYKLILKDINESILINDSIESLEKLRLELFNLNEKKIFYDEKEEIIKRNKLINEQIIPKYNDVKRIKIDLDLKVREYSDNLVIREDIVKRWDKVVVEYKDLSKLEIKLESLNREKMLCDDKLIEIREIKKLERELEEKKNILMLFELKEKRVILDEIKELDILNNALIIKEKKFNELTLKYEEYNSNYVKKYEEFLGEQAGILAIGLKDNCPCPVCGSLEHPNVATIGSSVLTKEEIDDLKDELDMVSKRLESLVIDINGLKKDIIVISDKLDKCDYQELMDEIKNLEDVIIESDVDIESYDNKVLEKEVISIEGIIRERSKSIDVDEDSMLFKINSLSNELEDVSNVIKEINSSYQILSLEKEKCDAVVATLEKDIDRLEKDYDTFNRDYVLSFEKLGYKNEDEYLDVMLDKNEMSKVEEDISLYRLKVVEVSSKIKSIDEFLRDKSIINVDILEQKKMTLEDKIKEKDIYLKKISNKLFNNLSIYNNIKNIYEKVIVMEKEIMIYKDLSDTANGNINGKNKLEFEQYVQANYFDMVIVSANKRFSYMTDERFLLSRKEEAIKISDKLGLELEVIDNYTGKRRDVRTLSGGESFKAALSLALGMSDVIQEFAGGIVVDAMFIDEGFGNLDDNSLEQAMNAIMMLGQGDKIIGIISHVNELKNRIDKKIVVKKSNRGSSVEVIV